MVAMETDGANCLAAARRAGHSVTLPAITSIATSLGALRVADALLEYCLEKVNHLLIKIKKIKKLRYSLKARSSDIQGGDRRGSCDKLCQVC